MLGTDIALKHEAAMLRHKEFIAEAKLQHDIANAFGENQRPRRGSLAEARTTVATLLLPAGSWLMPEETGGPGRRTATTLELRPGR